MTTNYNPNATSVDPTGKPGNYTLAPTIEDNDIYRMALDTRNFEITMFWQRSNYFLVLNSALAVGFFSLQNKGYAPLLALLGLFASLLWYRVNLGSKFWQSRWEYRLQEFERRVAPHLGFFSATRNIVQDDVTKSLEFNEHGTIRKFFDDQVLTKPSVSFSMTLLSLGFVVAWILALVLFWRQ